MEKKTDLNILNALEMDSHYHELKHLMLHLMLHQAPQRCRARRARCEGCSILTKGQAGRAVRGI